MTQTERNGSPAPWFPTWRGEASAWECDELGHLNMRHYPAKAEEARQFFFAHLGLPDAFRARAPSTVQARRIEVRYLAEARPGARLHIETGLVELGETTAVLLHRMLHADGRPAATLREEVSHIYRRTGAAFAWPRRLRERAEVVCLPQGARAGAGRGLVPLPVRAPNREALEALGADPIARGVFRADEANAQGRVRAMALFGRVSEGVGGFARAWPDIAAAHRRGEAHINGVLLEIAFYFHRRPEPGQAFEIWSGVARAGTKVRTLVHNIVDAATGESFASAEAVAALFDLQSRRIVEPDAGAMAELRANVVEGLTP